MENIDCLATGFVFGRKNLPCKIMLQALIKIKKNLIIKILKIKVWFRVKA